LEAASARGESLDPEMLRVASSLPRPVDGWMQGLSQGVRQVAVGSARRGVAQAWNGEVRQACREIVEGRYPFQPESERAVPLEDFARVFGRGGLIESFYREHMKDMVDTSGPTWRWKSGRPRQLGLPRSMPEQFRRASAIQRAFLGSGGSGASVSFSLKPLALDPQAEQVRLVVDGEDVTYSHGPPRSRQLKWPGSGNVSQARLSFTPAPETRPGGLTLNGPWAWFRLLDRSKIEAGQSGDVLKATFRLGERHARFEIRADSVENPFVLDELRNFSCPPQL
jgi:type VI secretion system protein ImpL